MFILSNCYHYFHPSNNINKKNLNSFNPNNKPFPSMSQTPTPTQSKTQQEINRQINFIYQHLIKLGYPKIVEINLTKVQEMEAYLAGYFQCTPARMQLVEWLVAVVFPDYREMAWYIIEKDPLVRIMKCLWKVGVLPINKHTKNLDYKKYLQATLGYQNAVSLIYNLVQLAYENVLSKKAKNDLSFGQFSHQLIGNFTELVNQTYDIYGITFPSKFINVNQMKQSSSNNDENDEYLDQFQKQYQQFYVEKMVGLLEKQDQLLDRIYAKKQVKSDQLTNSMQKFVDQLSKYGREYSEKYTKLVDRIDELLSSVQIRSRIIPYFIQQKQEQVSKEYKPSVKESVDNRSIRISPQFCRKYMNYKRTLKQIKYPKDDQQFMDQRIKLMQKIQQINQQICL